ncbi:MAG TPA: NmrA/HSCARG family protein [Nevskia sp.]|nr:NmrA/HSCARG family protein [Nevskia sp.]
MSILVTGSTGVIGAQVLAHLQGKSVEVRALTRSPEKARFPAGVTAVKGDLSDIDSVRQALQGVSTLFLLVPVAADEVSQSLQALNAAREAGVKGIVYLSVFMAGQYAEVPHFTAKHTVERMIEALDMPATVLRPSYFMQNDERLRDALLGGGVYGMPIGSPGISMADVRDIGEAAALELLRRERAAKPLPRETYELVGPEPVNAESAVAIWSEALGRPIGYVGDDLDALEQRMRAFSPAWLAYDMRLMFGRYQRDGAVALDSEVERLEALLGRRPRGYREFAREMAAQWAKG